MPETIFNENIAKLQNVYSILIKGDTKPGKEAEFRVEIIDIISNLEAAIVGVKSSNEEFIVVLVKLRENILSWNTPGAMFRQQIGIIDLFNELFFKAKGVEFNPIVVESNQPDTTNLNSVVEETNQPEATNLKTETDENDRSEATRLKKELASMKSELGDLKDLISSLMKEKKKQNDTVPQQPAVEEKPQEIIAPVATEETKPKSQLPWKREAKPVASIPKPPVITLEVAEEPPVLLPIISEDKPKEIQTPPVVEEVSTPDEAAFEASATIQKLSQTSKPYAEPAQVIDQMKSIITKAEEETRKDISAFKDRLEEEAKPPVVPVEDHSREVEKITPPIIEAPVAEEAVSPVATELDTPVIPPTEPVVEEKVSGEPDTDPYMQLLTLEAEKYRLEKEIEKNETDFQEGLKSKQEFDENITKINGDLAKVRDYIDLLRQQLIS
ncbi:MAG: hypothetical protein ACTSPK_00585 [Candidatus Heimdallarchaeota archaeon]